MLFDYSYPDGVSPNVRVAWYSANCFAGFVLCRVWYSFPLRCLRFRFLWLLLQLSFARANGGADHTAQPCAVAAANAGPIADADPTPN